jgi:hypothetical protein
MKARMLIVAAVLATSVLPAYAATITVTSTNDSGPGSLRDALANAADGDTIDASGVSGTILLTSCALVVTNSAYIVGPGPDLLAVNGHYCSEFVIGTNIDVSISGLTLTNGWTGIYNDHATLTVSNCTLSGNPQSGIINDGSGGNAGLVVVDCILSGNRARENSAGGGILNNAESGIATAKILNSTLSGNSGSEHEFGGGGICNDGGGGNASMEIVNSTLTGNSSPGNGGAICNETLRGLLGGTASVEIVNSVVISNSASSHGGDIEGLGGGIYNSGPPVYATLTVINSIVSSNSGSSGGGIGNLGSAKLSNCTVSGNSVTFLGGGIFNNGTMQIDVTTVNANPAYEIGGIFSFIAGDMQISNSTISSNAPGGIWNRGVMQIVNSTLSGNGSSNLTIGGAILNDGTLQVGHCTISDNSAQIGGGICNFESGMLEVGDTILKAGATGSNFGVAWWLGPGTITSLGYNLSSDDGGGFLTATGDQTNTDPMLGPLQDNGGPTFTCALLPGSPAINAGDPNFSPPPDFDQRGPGFLRVAYGRIDIGAFEAQTPCSGPDTGGTWLSHGQYVAAVVREATDFLNAGLISRRQWVQVVTQAAQSRCGWNWRCDRDGDQDWSRAWDCDRDAHWGRDRNY